MDTYHLLKVKENAMVKNKNDRKINIGFLNNSLKIAGDREGMCRVIPI